MENSIFLKKINSVNNLSIVVFTWIPLDCRWLLGLYLQPTGCEEKHLIISLYHVLF